MPVVLVHGVGADLTSWDPIAAALARRYRVICLDLRGHGKSGQIERCALVGCRDRASDLRSSGSRLLALA